MFIQVIQVYIDIYRYIGKVQTNRKPSEYGRVLYIYEPTTTQIYTISGSTLQWIFPDKYSKTIGLSAKGFEFTLPNLTDSLKNLLEPSSGLLNQETGTKETSPPTKVKNKTKNKTMRLQVDKELQQVKIKDLND